MQISEAIGRLNDYYNYDNPKESDRILYVESLEYLIAETKDPKYMTELAWYYCDMKRFDLEIKYLEMAAEYGYLPAYEELGYMYYYGQHGVQDYKKAFECFTKGAEGKDGEGSKWCRFKLADMYRFGCYVEKDEQKYREIIEQLFTEIKSPCRLSNPFPEIALFDIIPTWKYEKMIKEEIPSSDYYIGHVDFTSFHRYEITPDGLDLQFIHGLLNKIIAPDQRNVIRFSFDSECQTCPNRSNCPIYYNYSKLCSDDGYRDYIVEMLAEAIIKHNVAPSVREINNFFYEIIAY